MSPTFMIVFICLAFAFRFATLGISIRHERRLKAEGAREYGAVNSIVLALLHIAFYVCAILEWSLADKAPLSSIQIFGFALYLFAALMLVLVIRALGPLWTVKIIIATNHRLIASGPFRWVRHPNYVLNIVPELIGFALALGAYRTLFIGLPVYLVSLVLRIRQEEAAMRQAFPDYGQHAA